MATSKKTQIVITANASVAKKVMDELAQRTDAIKQKMAALDVTTAKGRREFNKLKKELVSYNSAISQNITDEERVKHAIDNLSTTSLRKLRTALASAKKVLGTTFQDDPNLKKKQQDVKTLQAQIDKLSGSVHKQGGAWQTALKNLTAYVGLFGAFNMIKTKISEIINLNLKLSDQLADIRKVSGWAMSDVNELSKRLAKIDTRNTIQQMNDLAYQGAKLGIGKYGVDGLTRFAEATAQIRMALHEDMGDEAIAQLAKMAEVMGDMEHMGVSQSLLASGSAIFKLSATTTACGSNIMEFSKRLLGLGKTADLTTPQILALGSAADSMALMPEVASTAFNKFITTLQSKYGQVAKAVGMNQERLKSLLDQHKTMEAIVEVLEHMRDMGDLNALAPIMGDLGSEGARLTNVFASMASNVDILKEHLATSEDEFAKATAVTAEFDIQNETSQALIERANNIWEKSFVNSDNAAGGIHDIAAAWYDMTKAITESLSFMGEAGLLLKSITLGIQVLIGALPALINGLLYFGMVKLAGWAQWPVIINAVTAAAGRAGTAMLNLVGIHTASQRAAIATARANQATAESMYIQAVAAQEAALANQANAVTQEQVAAANAAAAAADADLLAAQQMLASSTLEVSAATGVEAAEVLRDSQIKLYEAATNEGLFSSEIELAESKGMATAMANAQTAAIERETVAKNANTTATKNMRLAWGAILFISLISLLDKFYEKIQKINKAEEDQKEVTDKIANGLATANEEFEKASKNLRTLYSELERNFGQMEERKRLIGEINSKYGEYIGYLDVETLKVGNLKRSYNDATDALREYYFYKQKEALTAELVTEQEHKAAVSITKLGQMPEEYAEKANINIIETFIKEYARQGSDSSEATDRLFKMLYPDKDIPSNVWFNLRKIPIIGGFFKDGLFRSDEQKAMGYLNEAVRFIYTSLNNKATIEKSFPGEYKPKPRPKKNSVNNTKPDASKPEDDARNNISEFVTKIKNFYERQKTATIEDLTEKNVEKELQEQALAEIEKKEAAALAAAQQSIVLGNNAWAEFSPSMDQDLVEKDDKFGQSQSRMLKDAVQGVNTKKLRADLLKHMPKIKKGKVVGEKSDESDRAYLDKQWLEASKEERKQATIEQKRMAERQKELLEHSYTGVVKHNTFLGLVTSGYADVDLKNVERDKLDVFKFLEKSRQDLAGLYATDGEKDKLLAFLFGEDYKETPEVFKSLLGMSEADAKLFYQKLIQYSDEYIAAEKKQYDDAKKYANQMWANTQRNLDNQEKLRKLQNDGKMYGKRNNFLSNLGLKDVPADPEVELMKARMRAAQDYYAFVFANSKNMQLVREADKARQEAELNYANQMATAMKSRLSQMQSLVQPIEEFGSAVGQALDDMKNDADSANQAIKNALKSMLESWAKMALNDVNTQMWKAINDAGVKKAKDKAQPDIKAGRKASANAAANGELNIPSDLGTAANPVHAIIDAMPLSNLGKDDGTGENGTGVPFADTKSGGNVKPVSTEHSPSGKTGNAPASPTTAVSPTTTNVASQTGEAAASVATGQSSFGEAAAGMAGSVIGAIMNTDFGSKQSRREKREQRKQQREAKKHQKELTKETKQGVKERETINKKGNKEITKSTEEESKAQVKTEELKQNTTNAIVDTALNTNFQLKKNNDQQVVEQSKNTAHAENTFSIVGAVGKCFEFLGPIAGPIAAAAVMALLTGLMQWGLNAAFGGGKNKSNKSSSKNTKLVSGMLTYDSGNVQDMKPFVGDNGEIYWAKEQDKPKSGVNLLTTPTATTINGQRALVAENGPELVIGRETTKAMMMNNPSLLKALVNYDANYSGRNAARRAFDEGNLAEALGNLSSGASATDGLIADSRAANIALITAINTLMQRLDQPIHAKIDMYGRGNLYDSMSKANQFMKGKS